MKIEGINLADVPVMSSANADDLALIVQQNGLRLQSYQNLTSTYYPISGSLKVPGVTLPLVQIATAQPTDELVLIVENNGLAVKQIGFAAPTMAVGSSIEVEGIALPSVRFSGTIDGDEYVIAVRENKLCLIPIPNSFSAGALPTAGRTMLANLTSSLILDEGTGGPTWSRATKAWGFNELGYLKELASGCAFFGGARLVRNTVRTTSEDFSNAAWPKDACTVTGTNTIVCSNATDQMGLFQSSGLVPNVVIGQNYLYGFRVRYVSGGAEFVQVLAGALGFGIDFINVSLLDGTSSTTGGVFSRVTEVVPGTYDIILRAVADANAAGEYAGVAFCSSLSSSRYENFVGDGIKSFELLRAWSVDVTNYDTSYVPEYVSVGVEASPYFGAGIDGAKYFETDWQGAPIAAANLLGFRREEAATNNLLQNCDLTQNVWGANANGGTGSELLNNGDFSTSTDWSPSGAAYFSVSGGVLNVNATDSSAAYANATQASLLSALIAGHQYVIEFDYVHTSGSAPQVNIAGIGAKLIGNSTGRKTITVTCGTGSGVKFGTFWANVSTIDNVTIKYAPVQCRRTATGISGIANTATTLTAATNDAIILQPITLASAARCASAYVKRRTGTGTISFTQDGGSTWTDITSQINSSTWSRVRITATLANPSVGFKISTSGDAIDVDCVQNEAGSAATSPIVTTTAAVTRNAESLTYQTASNWSDTAGTAYIEAQPLSWVAGGAIGSATNGLLLSAANSGATASDGTNTANGPAGTPSGRKKLALRWGGGAMTVASGGVVGTPGTYDGAMGLASIGIAVNSSTYCGPVAIYNYQMTDAALQAITA